MFLARGQQLTHVHWFDSPSSPEARVYVNGDQYGAAVPGTLADGWKFPVTISEEIPLGDWIQVVLVNGTDKILVAAGSCVEALDEAALSLQQLYEVY